MNRDDSLSNTEGDPAVFRSDNSNNVTNGNTHDNFLTLGKEMTQACQWTKMISGVRVIGSSVKGKIWTFWQSISGT